MLSCRNFSGSQVAESLFLVSFKQVIFLSTKALLTVHWGQCVLPSSVVSGYGVSSTNTEPAVAPVQGEFLYGNQPEHWGMVPGWFICSPGGGLATVLLQNS
jgi:hypothetical protein